MTAPARRPRPLARKRAAAVPRRPRRTQAQRSAEATEKLLAAALACLARHGYAATSITEIAEAAGMSRGALQHHFDTKADLLFAVFARFSASLVAALDGVDAGLPQDARAHAVAHALWGRFGDPGYGAMLELMLGSRSEPPLWRRVCRRRDADAALMRAAMARLFPEADALLLKDTLAFGTATLRGLAFYRLFVADPGFYDRAVALLGETMEQRLS
jgi:AcrR family transcriptional regulator